MRQEPNHWQQDGSHFLFDHTHTLENNLPILSLGLPTLSSGIILRQWDERAPSLESDRAELESQLCYF